MMIDTKISKQSKEKKNIVLKDAMVAREVEENEGKTSYVGAATKKIEKLDLLYNYKFSLYNKLILGPNNSY